MGLLSQREEVRVNAAKVMNKHRHLLGLPKGKVLNLFTGAVRDAVKGDFLTQCIPVLPVAGRPTVFEEALKGMFGRLGKKEYKKARNFLLWHMRQSLFGKGPAKMFLFLQGTSNTGKSLMGEIYFRLHGDIHDGGYGLVLDPERLLTGDKEHKEWMMPLQSARFVWADEFPDDRGTLNPSVVGPMSNAGKMAARGFNVKTEGHLDTQCHLVVTSNHRPKIRNDGSKKRLHMIPMNVIQEVDEKLQETLLSDDEIGKLLHLLTTKAPKLKPEMPQDWMEASGSYVPDAGVMDDFVRLYCELGPDHKVAKSKFRKTFLKYCQEVEEDVDYWKGTNQRVGSALSSAVNGLESSSVREKGRVVDAYKNIRLTQEGLELHDSFDVDNM